MMVTRKRMELCSIIVWAETYTAFLTNKRKKVNIEESVKQISSGPVKSYIIRNKIIRTLKQSNLKVIPIILSS